MHEAVIEAPFGQLRLSADSECLTGVEFLLEPHRPVRPSTPLLAEAAAQLAAYFEQPAYRFHLPLRLEGSAFQLRVWQALRDIPPGAPLTYGELARMLGTAPRAVGGACGANPIPVVLPCHRVVAANGLGGFMHTRYPGPLSIKSWLLAHERG